MPLVNVTEWKLEHISLIYVIIHYPPATLPPEPIVVKDFS